MSSNEGFHPEELVMHRIDRSTGVFVWKGIRMVLLIPLKPGGGGGGAGGIGSADVGSADVGSADVGGANRQRASPMGSRRRNCAMR